MGSKLMVGIPIYNGEKWIAKTLESILGQTFADFRLCIADNASEDGTEDICRSYESADNRVHYVRHSDNIGAARNYNYLVQRADADYFKWAAADDLCRPSLFERCVDALEQRPALVGVYARSMSIDETGLPLDEIRDNLRLESKYPHIRFGDVIARSHSCWPIFGVYRTPLLRRTGLIRPFPNGDRVPLAELALAGPIARIPEILQTRRVHEDSFSSGRRSGQEWKAHFWNASSDYERVNWIQLYRDLVFASGLQGYEKVRCLRQVELRFRAKQFRYEILRRWVWPARMSITRRLEE